MVDITIKVISSDPRDEIKIRDIIMKKSEELEKALGYKLNHGDIAMMVTFSPEFKQYKSVSFDFMGTITIVVD